jgi:hypothetical protein
MSRLVEFAITGSLVIYSLGLLAEQDYATILATMGTNGVMMQGVMLYFDKV